MLVSIVSRDSVTHGFSCVWKYCIADWSAATWYLSCLEILHFDWLVNWLGPMVLEGALVVYAPGSLYFVLHTHTQDRLD